MPLFEFVCRECDRAFEELVFGNERPTCPDCGATQIDKQLSVPARGRVTNPLPVCPPGSSAGCGLPQCGQGGCQFE